MEQDLKARLDDFCADFEIPEKHYGSLRLLSGMAFVLGFDIEVQLSPHKEQSE